MKRKQFLATALTAFPALAFSRLPFDVTAINKPFVIRSGEARRGGTMLYKGKHPNNIIISKQDTGGAVSVFAYTGYDMIGPSRHLHTHQDEIFFVTKGRFRFAVGDETLELNEGDTIFLPRNVAHTWIQLTSKGQLLYAVQPAGTLEEFFIEMNALKAPPTEEEARLIHEKHGMKLVGPGLTID